MREKSITFYITPDRSFSFIFTAPDDGKEGRIVLVGVKAGTLGHRSRGREKEVAGGGEGCVALLRIAKKGGERERKSWQ